MRKIDAAERYLNGSKFHKRLRTGFKALINDQRQMNYYYNDMADHSVNQLRDFVKFDKNYNFKIFMTSFFDSVNDQPISLRNF